VRIPQRMHHGRWGNGMPRLPILSEKAEHEAC
jgi:hypothetical protein